MYRRKTVEALLRQNARERETLLAMIKDQADRLMYLVDKQYAPTPLDLAPRDLDDEELDEQGDDPGQLPDDLGYDAY